jgi:hypothetical protein
MSPKVTSEALKVENIRRAIVLLLLYPRARALTRVWARPKLREIQVQLFQISNFFPQPKVRNGFSL